MPIYTKDRPDPRYYRNIVQGDDGNWAAEQMPLDDVVVTIGARTYPTAGLRTVQAQGVISQAIQLIGKYATEELQRNALYILSTTTSGTPWTNAKAMMDWIASVNSYRDAQVANVRTLNFNQLIAYSVPIGTPPWPTPPASLPPVTLMQAYADMRE